MTQPEHNGIINVEDEDDYEEIDHLAKLQIVTNHIEGSLEDDDNDRRLSLDSVELEIEDIVTEELESPPVRINNHRKLLVTKDHNIRLKKLVVKEVKRPGRSEYLSIS